MVSTNGPGTSDIYMQKEVDPILTPYSKVDSEWIWDLNVRAKLKLLGEEEAGLGNGFLDTTQVKTGNHKNKK